MWLPLNRRKHLKNLFFWYFYFLRNEGCFLYDSHPCFSLVIFLNSEIQHWLECKKCDFSPILSQRAFQPGTGDSRNWEWVISRFTMGVESLKETVLEFMNVSHMWKLKGLMRKKYTDFFPIRISCIFENKQKNPSRIKVPFSPLEPKISLQCRWELNLKKCS